MKDSLSFIEIMLREVCNLRRTKRTNMKGNDKLLTALNQLLADELTAISLAHEVADQSTVELLTKILKMEEGHVDWAEIQRAQIEQMGLENYLTNQTEGAAS